MNSSCKLCSRSTWQTSWHRKSFLLLGATAAVLFFAPGRSYGLSESGNSPEAGSGLSVKASTVEIQEEYRTVKELAHAGDAPAGGERAESFLDHNRFVVVAKPFQLR